MSNLDLSADIIDVRDIIERIEELRSERDDYADDEDRDSGNGPQRWAEENREDADELGALESIMEDLAGYGGDEQWEGDWYPITLIDDSYFTEYCQQMVEDIGDLPSPIPYYIEIDWEATARNIRMDYSSTEINGRTYWYR